MNANQQRRASRVINAPASEIFALLADPNRHGVIDGSDMLRGPDPGTKPVTRVGQTFRMRMHHPQLGDYQMINTVTSFEPEAQIGWAPDLDPSSGNLLKKLGVGNVSGHTFTYELRMADGGATVVTQTYDWSGVDDPDFAKLCPLLSEEQLAQTLDKIAQELEQVRERSTR
jgi:hypothetical protein